MAANVLMRQFANRAQQRQRHFAGTMVLQLPLIPVAAIDHFEQEVVSGMMLRAVSALGSRKDAWQIVADLYQLLLGNAADEQVGLERILDRLT